MTNSTNRDTYCVIMAGGIGTRFWPMSTSKYPKQFHDILGTGKTLIQQTFERLLKVTDKHKIYVITDASYADLVAEQLPQISKEQIIAEPVGMNTAACVLYSALKLNKLNQNAKMLICPSDHLILNEERFAEKVNIALSSIDTQDGLYTLGINPTRPDTGYGYIQFKEGDSEVKEVKTFTEKPSLEIAEKFLQSGEFLWNSGIFIWSSHTILKAFKAYLPEMYQQMYSVLDALNTASEEKEIARIYPTLQKTSIDVGILEKGDNVYVLPVSFGWSDLGTWSSLYATFNKNEENNAVNAHFSKFYNAGQNMVHVEGEKAVVIDGLEDYIVVDTEKALLICPLENDQKVKQYVNDLKLSKGEKFV